MYLWCKIEESDILIIIHWVKLKYYQESVWSHIVGWNSKSGSFIIVTAVRSWSSIGSIASREVVVGASPNMATFLMQLIHLFFGESLTFNTYSWVRTIVCCLIGSGAAWICLSWHISAGITVINPSITTSLELSQASGFSLSESLAFYTYSWEWSILSSFPSSCSTWVCLSWHISIGITIINPSLRISIVLSHALGFLLRTTSSFSLSKSLAFNSDSYCSWSIDSSTTICLSSDVSIWVAVINPGLRISIILS